MQYLGSSKSRINRGVAKKNQGVKIWGVTIEFGRIFTHLRHLKQ